MILMEQKKPKTIKDQWGKQQQKSFTIFSNYDVKSTEL